MATNTDIKTKMNFKIVNENFKDLLDKLKDLSAISNIVKFKIDKDNILIYSLVGETAILAFKNFTLNTKDYLEPATSIETDYNIDFILYNTSAFIKKLNVMDSTKEIKLSFSIKVDEKTEDDDIVNYTCRSLKITDGRLKASEIGGELHKIRDVNKEQLNILLDTDKSKWSYMLEKEQLSDIVKLSSINADVKIININVKKGDVIVKEQLSWDLLLGKASEDVSDTEIIFGKKYLKSICSTEDIEFSVFDTFILFKDTNSNLMVSFEQTFEDEDYE